MIEQKEVWENIQGFNGSYRVSNLGRVISYKRKNIIILKPKYDKDGYHEYKLSSNKKVVCKRGHRLVAEAFIPNPSDLPIINHKNLIKDDNNVNNLEWCTYAHNTIHGYKNNPDKRIGKGFSDLSNEELLHAVVLYKKGYFYQELNDYFKLETSQDLWTDVFMGRRYSEVTKIISDIRDGRSPSYKYSTEEVYKILELYYNKGMRQKDIVVKLKLNAPYVSETVNGKHRKEVYEKFMESYSG